MSSTIRAPPTPCHLQRSSQSRRDVRDFDFLFSPLAATKSGIGFFFFFFANIFLQIPAVKIMKVPFAAGQTFINKR